MALTNSATPVVTNTGDSLAVDPVSGAIIGIDPASNDVAISQTGSENKIQFSQAVGENVVELGSAVAISQTSTENKVQLSQASGENGVDLVNLAWLLNKPISITQTPEQFAIGEARDMITETLLPDPMTLETLQPDLALTELPEQITIFETPEQITMEPNQ